jgi:hypothetical protein
MATLSRHQAEEVQKFFLNIAVGILRGDGEALALPGDRQALLSALSDEERTALAALDHEPCAPLSLNPEEFLALVPPSAPSAAIATLETRADGFASAEPRGLPANEVPAGEADGGASCTSPGAEAAVTEQSAAALAEPTNEVATLGAEAPERAEAAAPKCLDGAQEQDPGLVSPAMETGADADPLPEAPELAGRAAEQDAPDLSAEQVSEAETQALAAGLDRSSGTEQVEDADDDPLLDAVAHREADETSASPGQAVAKTADNEFGGQPEVGEAPGSAEHAEQRASDDTLVESGEGLPESPTELADGAAVESSPDEAAEPVLSSAALDVDTEPQRHPIDEPVSDQTSGERPAWGMQDHRFAETVAADDRQSHPVCDPRDDAVPAEQAEGGLVDTEAGDSEEVEWVCTVELRPEPEPDRDPAGVPLHAADSNTDSAVSPELLAPSEIDGETLAAAEMAAAAALHPKLEAAATVEAAADAEPLAQLEAEQTTADAAPAGTVGQGFPDSTAVDQPVAEPDLEAAGAVGGETVEVRAGDYVAQPALATAAVEQEPSSASSADGPSSVEDDQPESADAAKLAELRLAETADAAAGVTSEEMLESIRARVAADLSTQLRELYLPQIEQERELRARAEQRVRELELELRENGETLVVLRSELDHLGARNARLDLMLEEARAELRSLRDSQRLQDAQFQEQQAHLQAARAQLRDAAEREETLRSEATSAKASLAKALKEIESLRIEMGKLLQQRQQDAELMSAREDELRELRSERMRQAEAVQAAQALVAELRAENAELRGQLDAWFAERAASETTMASLRTELAQARKELEGLRATVTAATPPMASVAKADGFLQGIPEEPWPAQTTPVPGPILESEKQAAALVGSMAAATGSQVTVTTDAAEVAEQPASAEDLERERKRLEILARPLNEVPAKLYFQAIPWEGPPRRLTIGVSRQTLGEDEDRALGSFAVAMATRQAIDSSQR